MRHLWFLQRDRVLANTWEMKWHNFWDALTRQRTDGAMVRLVTPLGDPRDDDAARARLLAFMRALHGRLAYYLPPAEALPMADGAALLHAIQDVYLCAEVTIA